MPWKTMDVKDQRVRSVVAASLDERIDLIINVFEQLARFQQKSVEIKFYRTLRLMRTLKVEPASPWRKATHLHSCKAQQNAVIVSPRSEVLVNFSVLFP